MNLITEQIEENIEVLIEENSKSGQKTYFIKGPFMVAETKNKNGRIYPLNVLMRECYRYNEELISKNRGLGECGHPDNPQINLDRVSHMITELKPQGNSFTGKAKLLDTPHGKIVKSLLDGGVTLGVSTRGVGSLRPHNGAQLVQEDFKLAAIDVVSDPSGPGCFVQGIMEGKSWIWDNGLWKEEILDNARKTIQNTPSREIEEVALKIFENFVRKL
jgi:hypothetical protein